MSEYDRDPSATSPDVAESVLLIDIDFLVLACAERRPAAASALASQPTLWRDALSAVGIPPHGAVTPPRALSAASSGGDPRAAALLEAGVETVYRPGGADDKAAAAAALTIEALELLRARPSLRRIAVVADVSGLAPLAARMAAAGVALEAPFAEAQAEAAMVDRIAEAVHGGALGVEPTAEAVGRLVRSALAAGGGSATLARIEALLVDRWGRERLEASAWLGNGAPAALLRAALPPDITVDETPPGRVVEASATARLELLPEGQRRAGARALAAGWAPALSTSEFAVVFGALAQAGSDDIDAACAAAFRRLVAAGAYAPFGDLRALASRARAAGGATDCPTTLAAAYADGLAARLVDGGLAPDGPEIAEMRRWICGAAPRSEVKARA